MAERFHKPLTVLCYFKECERVEKKKKVERSIDHINVFTAYPYNIYSICVLAHYKNIRSELL